MPSPPLPPRIELTEDLHPTRGWTPKKKGRSSSNGSEAPANTAAAVFANGLVFFCAILMACLLAALWQWQKAEKAAKAASNQAVIATKFGDGVLQDLALAREQSAKLDRERGNLVRMLGDAERLHATLRADLNTWRQKHQQVLGTSQEALAEWNQYRETLEKNLGATREQLAETNGKLQQQRSVAQQLVSVSDGERESAERNAGKLAQQKQAVESENQDLNQKADDLDAENARLQANVTRLRGVVSTLETSNNVLDARNAALVTDINVLRNTIRKLEQNRDNNDSSKRGN